MIGYRKIKIIGLNPPKKKFILFDELTTPYVDKVIRPEECLVVGVRDRMFYLVPFFLAFVLGISNRKSFMVNYLDILCFLTDAKFLVTSNDNSLAFMQADRGMKLTKLAIQNGWRTKTNDLENLYKNKGSIRCDYYLCFNAHIGSLFFDLTGANAVVVGSFRLNEIYQSLNKYFTCEHSRLVGFISQFEASSSDLTQGWVFSIVSAWCKLKGFEVKVLLRNTNEHSINSEKIFFEAHCVEGFDIGYCHRHALSSNYQASSQFQFIVTLDSTLGYELLALGRKVCFISVRGSCERLDGYSFGWPAEYPVRGEFWSSVCDEQEWLALLERMDRVDLPNLCKEGANLVAIDAGNLKLREILGALK